MASDTRRAARSADLAHALPAGTPEGATAYLDADTMCTPRDTRTVGEQAGFMGPDEISREEFEDLVGEALDTIPPALTRLMDNVVIVVEDDPPSPGLLGLYHGVPLTERGDAYAGVLPDRIAIYRNPLTAVCRTRDDLVEEVRITVVHEIAHHFGIDDERLHELGW